MSVAVPLGGGAFAVPGNRWDLLDGCAPDSPPSVSVVVPHFNAQRQLDRLLLALAGQTHPRHLLEVIVADDGSARRPLIHAPADLAVHVVGQADAGFRAAAARNLGAAAATGDVLCFLDVDTVPEPGYLQSLTRLPALCPDALVTGRRRHADLSAMNQHEYETWLAGGRELRELSEPQWLSERHASSGNLLRLAEDSYRFVISSVLGCSRSLFAELGGFDESFSRYGGEDWELAHRALCAGAVLAHVPDAVAWHDGPSWAERGDAESRRDDKNAETLALTGLVPDASRRGRMWTGRPDVVVEIGTDGEELAAVAVAVHSVLAGDLDAGVWLSGKTAFAVKQNGFAREPRVTAGPVSTEALASARVRVVCSRPLRVDVDCWPILIGQVTAPDSRAGQLVIDTGDGRLTMTSTGALARAARWSPRLPRRDLVAELFGRARLASTDCGVSAVDRRPDLAYELAHLREPRRLIR